MEEFDTTTVLGRLAAGIGFHERNMPKSAAELFKTAKADFEQLQAENKRLKEALEIHLHTQKCFEYAAKTARDHGNYYCIAECADSHRQALK